MFLNGFIGNSFFSSPDKDGQGRQDLSAHAPMVVNIIYFSSSYEDQPEARLRQYCRNKSTYLLQAGPGALDISFLMGFTNLNSVRGWQRGRKADAGILPAFVRSFS
jgi:hypothetical protein